MSCWPLVTGFKASMSKKEECQYPSFTNFTINVDVKRSWQSTVKKVLKSVQGVRNFRMENDGKINISGYIDPNQLLKSLQKAKGLELVHWQYGECSTNLFEKSKPPKNDNKNGAGGNYLYPGYGGYNGYGFNYGYPNYQTNYPFRHLECEGDASGCSGHHIETPLATDKSTKIASLFKDTTSSDKAPTCCSLM